MPAVPPSICPFRNTLYTRVRARPGYRALFANTILLFLHPRQQGRLFFPLRVFARQNVEARLARIIRKRCVPSGTAAARAREYASAIFPWKIHLRGFDSPPRPTGNCLPSDGIAIPLKPFQRPLTRRGKREIKASFEEFLLSNALVSR